MKEKKQNEKNVNQKEGKKLKIVVSTLVVALIAMIAIFGIYTQKENRMVNKVKGYTYAMDLKGERTIILSLATGKEEIIKDSEGKEITDAENLTEDELKEKGYTKEEVEKNKAEDLTDENYQKTKEIIEKRLKQLSVQQYNISINEQNGELTLNIPENEKTDDIINQIMPKGKFEIIDSETNEVLMNNNDIKEVKVLTGQSSSTQNGVNVYLDIQFNKEGTQKFETITGTYKTSSDTNTTQENTTDENSENSENTEETKKQITMKIDGETMTTTSFEDVIKTGKMSLIVGGASSENETIKENIEKAQNIASLMNNGEMPLEYEGYSQYILSDITRENLHTIEIAIIIITAVALLLLVIKYKTSGFLASIGFVGLAAIVAIIIRYTNVVIALEGIFAIAVILIINYIFQKKLLAKIKKIKIQNKEENILKKAMKETYKDFFLKIIPICIMAITFTFIKWIPISSFGMVMFWGLLLIAIYNPLITYGLLKIENK